MLRAVASLALVLQATFSVRTELVVLPVTVTDSRGRHVAGLSAESFRVMDNGRLSQIATFHSGEVPVTIGLVVDHSQSMSPKLAEVGAAVSSFSRMVQDHDEFFAVMFSNDVRRPSLGNGLPFTSDPEVLDAALIARIPSGQSAIYDAVAEGLRHLPLGTSPRKALIVVTDGGDNASKLKYHDVRELARTSQAVIYGIGLVGANSQDENPELLKRLCRDTGGAAYFPEADRSVADVFAEIARDLHEQYTLSIPSGPAVPGRESHSIDVRATGPDGKKLKVRTRSSYDVKAAK